MDERQLRKHFHAEAEELIETLLADVELLGSGADVSRPNPALVNRVFRTVHSLKGLAGMANVAVVHRVAHALEDVLENVRMGRMRVDQRLVDAFGVVADDLGDLIRAVARDTASERDADRILETIDAVRNAEAVVDDSLDRDLVSIDPALFATLTEYEEHRLRDNVRERLPIYELRVAFDLTAFDQGYRSMSERLGAVGEIIGTLPGMAADDPMKIAFRILFACSEPQTTVSEITADSGGTLEVLSHYEREPANPLPVATAVSSSIRLEMSVLDDLSLLTDNLGIQVAGLGATCASMARHLSLSPRELFELRQQQTSIERAFAELQERIVDARLVPVGPTLIRTRRLVEKLARQLSREVEFDATGEDVRLDKFIVDRIAEPLAHLIANAMDHGIELPVDRVSSGKPAAGSLRIAAESSGNRIALTISDDGRGIDVDAVRQAARERGVDDATLEAVSPLSLIFTPGLSTAARVTGLSGRGVGLDAVASVVADLGGEIRVDSEPGRGTMFTIELPTTLVMLPAFLVEASGWTYAVDVNQLVELCMLEPGLTDRATQTIGWRDELLPFYRLSDLVRTGDAPWQEIGRIPCLIARHGHSQAAIAVDRFVGERDVIVKSFGRHAATLRGVSGAIELEDRQVALLIDLPELIGEEALVSR